MELWQEIIRQMLLDGEIRFQIPDGIDHLMETKCYAALSKIRDVIRDDSLSDEECFMKIEEVIRIFEGLGSSGGFRHDFG